MNDLNGPEGTSNRAALMRVSIGILVLIVGFGSGFLVGQQNAFGELASADSAQPAGVDFSPVWKAWNIIQNQYVPVAVASSTPIATSSPKVTQEKVWGMISGLADSLNDPYTYFLPPEENQQFSSDMSGSFDGVGMEIDVKNQVLTVVSPLKGTPADLAGIKAGDQILSIDGTSTQGMDVTTAVQAIRGPKGSQVTLMILRSGWDKPREFKVTRDTINVPEVETTARPDGIFVISVAEFTANSPDLFRSALRQFVESGDSKLILDLRGNPGGYLDAAVDIGSWFLPSGDTIVTEDYDGHAQNIVHRSYGYDIFNKNLKMVVLVDKGSASAAEILADALHSWGVAQLIGTNTYGKGSVQELVPITADTALKITVARWIGPDGKPIPTTGIVPDQQVPLTDADITAHNDTQLNTAVQLLGGDTTAKGTAQVVE
ncbi:MAG TPA: S41 family peptidase [Candidatus Paceibacterota bacterium]|nr:S41 family peptidase [Candidatus Paceibacterota bacterium]